MFAFILSCAPTRPLGETHPREGDDTGVSAGDDDADDADDYDGDDHGGDADVDVDTDVDTGLPTDTDTGEPECDEAKAVTLPLQAEDSNSMAAAVLARIAVLEGWGDVAKLANRAHEFLSYYEFDYPVTEGGSLVVTPSMATNDDGTWTLHVGVSSPAVDNDDRVPLNLVLSIDASCSMTGEAADATAWTIEAIAGSLRAGDVVGAVQWAEEPVLLLESHVVSGPDDPAVLGLVADLRYGGTTDLADGLDVAVAGAAARHGPDVRSGVLVVSDGGTYVGESDADTLRRHASPESGRGIRTGVVGVGKEGYYDEETLDAISDAGRGPGVFVNAPADADWAFGAERFASMFDVAAEDVRIEVTFPPGFGIVRTRRPDVVADSEVWLPQDLAPGASIVMHEVIASCAPEGVGDWSFVVIMVRWSDPDTGEEHVRTVTTTFEDLLGQDQRFLRKASAVRTYAAALRDVERVDEALRELAAAEALVPHDPDLAEIRSVLEAL